MRPLWLGIRPMRQGTQLLGMRGSETILQARLRRHPQHRQAFLSLLESLALWEGSKVHAAVCVDAGGGWCHGEIWDDLFTVFGSLLYEVHWVGAEEFIDLAERADPTSLGDFDALLGLRVGSALEMWPE